MNCGQDIVFVEFLFQVQESSNVQGVVHSGMKRSTVFGSFPLEIIFRSTLFLLVTAVNLHYLITIVTKISASFTGPRG